jgi:SAM-dependent methyltransferase
MTTRSSEVRSELPQQDAASVLLDNYLELVDDSAVAILPHVLRLTVELGIADALADEALSAEEIATTVLADQDAISRLLRGLEALGVLERDGANRFRLTSAGARLRSGAPGGVRQSVVNTDSQLVWLHALETIRSGRSAFRGTLGADFFTHKDSDSQSDEAFLARSRERMLWLYPEFARTHDWTSSTTVLDIGGGNGAHLEHVLRQADHLRGVLFDRPGVVDGVRRAGLTGVLADRCELVGGDFFEGLPSGADTHLMSSVLHDWTDEQALRVLASSRAALAPGGTLLVVEMVVPQDGGWHPSIWSDLGMMVLTGGRERTLAEFADLFAAGGYTLTSVEPIAASPCSVLTAR